MHSRASLIVLLLVSGSAGADASEIELFNGKDLAGWKPMHDGKFYVKDGCIVLEGGNGWLRTEKEYTDFDLSLEWRTEEKYRTSGTYDSGLFFRTKAEGKPWPPGKYQFNMKQGVGGDVAGIIKDGRADLLHAPGEWNAYRLICKGPHAEGFINGQLAWKTDKIKTPTGHLGLQAEGHRFEFRNLRLKPLGP
jgi:hypothetical protein